MDLIFVHGYSVRNTATYGYLPARLEQELAFRHIPVRIDHIFLGKYVSFHDQVTLADLSRAFQAAIRDIGLSRFACITHSTGGPLVRDWVLRYGGHQLSHLVMLAPANHGSPLAQLGKGRLSRIKAFFESVEPGQRILDWLEQGSEEQWRLNLDWLALNGPRRGLFPFVLTGQTIDRKFYDHLNSYTGEPGSDGVVRVPSANLNYSYVRLEQNEANHLVPTAWRQSTPTAFAVLPGLSHSGSELGIMGSVPLAGPHPTVDAILECLSVQNEANYQDLCQRFQSLTEQTQSAEALSRWRILGREFTQPNPPHSLAQFRVVDQRGQLLDDYDLIFTAGLEASPDLFPQGVFRDRQRNQRHPGRLTYFLDAAKLRHFPIGLEVHARPAEGLVRYAPARVLPTQLGSIVKPNEAILVEIVLKRLVDRNCFTLTQNLHPEPISGSPGGDFC